MCVCVWLPWTPTWSLRTRRHNAACDVWRPEPPSASAADTQTHVSLWLCRTLQVLWGQVCQGGAGFKESTLTVARVEIFEPSGSLCPEDLKDHLNLGNSCRDQRLFTLYIWPRSVWLGDNLISAVFYMKNHKVLLTDMCDLSSSSVWPLSVLRSALRSVSVERPPLSSGLSAAAVQSL